MNMLLKISLTAVIVAVFTLGCENIENPEPVSAIDTTRTATITGTVFAELDVTNAETEPAPQGTKVKVVLDSEDFVTSPQPGVQYQSLTYTTTLDASGNYNVEVPALEGPVSAVIYLDNFSADVEGDTSDDKVIFQSNPNGYTVQVIAGLTTFENITY